MQYVVIGNGVAGINAAEQVRLRHEEADITLISAESDHYFSRTSLMYIFCGQLSARDTEPFERDHYQRMNYQRVRDKVVSLDSSKKLLSLEGGSTISYDRLLIASGSRPFMAGYPGEELDGVGNFVTLQDLQWMEEKAKTARRAVVIGGGLIGIESIEVLSKAGIGCTFLVRENHFWPIAFSAEEGDMITAHMRHHGINVTLGTSADSIVGENGKVTGVKTEHGDVLPADMVVFSIGVTPQTGFLKDSGIELDERGGIIVDDYLRTSIPDVFAAGDCTSVVWFNGVRRPEQLWYTGRDQARVAGYNMASESGMERVYKRGTFYNSAKFFDIEYTTAGFVNFKFDGERDWYQREGDKDISQRITYMPDGLVIGFNMLGSRWDHRPLVKWVEEKRPIDWVLKHLHEAVYDEEFFRKFKVREPAPAY